MGVLLQEASQRDEMAPATDMGPEIKFLEKLKLAVPSKIPRMWWATEDPSKKIEKQEIEDIFKIFGGPDPFESLKKINKFISTDAKGRERYTAPNRLLKKLMIVETLKALSQEFEAGPGGKLFEYFIAALVGGKMSGVNQSNVIPDVIVEYPGATPRHISLKLLEGDVRGSFFNLAKLILGPSDAELSYLVGEKGDHEKIKFYNIKLEHTVEMLGKIINILQSANKRKLIKVVGEKYNEINPDPQDISDTSDDVGLVDKIIFLVSQDARFKHEFRINVKLFGALAGPESVELDLSEKSLTALYEGATKNLNEATQILFNQMVEILYNVRMFSGEITEYYSTERKEGKKDRLKNANHHLTNINTEVEKIPTTPEESS